MTYELVNGEPTQLPLFPPEAGALLDVPFPTTRYQGSKRKLIDWIWAHTQPLSFDTVLDVFGGTGAVSHLYKRAGKQVTYNDVLRFNAIIGQALIANQSTTLSDLTTETILAVHPHLKYPNYIQTTFGDIYFTDAENRWLDRVIWNIRSLVTNPFEQALALFALFQACIVKRPYNLFHRANLYMRTAEVKRQFGNKTTWDTPFEVHFRAFAQEANLAVFDNGRQNNALNVDALETPIGADLVYIDSPYLNARGVGVNYRDFYHFLEGMTDYDRWGSRLDERSRHRRLKPKPSIWNRADTISSAFDALFERHRHSILVISYRDDGIPSRAELVKLLKTYKRHVQEVTLEQKYVLAHKATHELLLIATD